MNIFPAIDLYGGKAVRLYKGDYSEMTVYSDRPIDIAYDFLNKGAKFIHAVDLEGARDGTAPNFDLIKSFTLETGLFVEVGGGIRSIDIIDKYLSCGIGRVILGTAAISDKELLYRSISNYGEKIAVGADIKDGYVAIRGWLEKSEVSCDEFFSEMQSIGVKTVICTDISRDGAMKGTNLELYKHLSEKYSVDIIASGGVSDLEDIRSLRDMGLYGAIIGKAYYTGAIDLCEAIREAK